ncbi:hypothetical protein EVAR_88117_1 [Eumeta japonica]|uniref:Transposable element P transposase-like RNase H C-terminal domain-containing protein n=1 Tax=Eumeta variegata TaxID=151549 RepID=A0A4C2AF85_EUMVA|nr:hypothetical protein EVAR_88117_1 [Eumeta japonica]
MPGTSEERQPTLSESYTTVFAQEEMAGTSPERQPIPSESYATDADGKPSTKVKCLRGYVLSMDTLRDIWYLLRKKYGFKHMNLRQFNQDALENIFGIIRQYNPTNRNPTCTNFIAALKSTIISGLTAPHSRSANCQKDYQKLLTNFHDMLFEENPTEPDLDQHVLSKTTESETVQITDVHSEVPVLTIPEEFDIVETDFTEIDKQPLVYISGYIASTVVKSLNCVVCEQALQENNPESNPIYSYITLREWWKDQHALTYPSIKLCGLIQDALDIFEKK